MQPSRKSSVKHNRCRAPKLSISGSWGVLLRSACNVALCIRCAPGAHFPVWFHLQGVPGSVSSSQCDPRREGEIPFKSTEGKVMEERYLLSYTNSNLLPDSDCPACFGFVIYLSSRVGLGAFHSFPIWMESSWEVLSKFIGLMQN